MFKINFRSYVEKFSYPAGVSVLVVTLICMFWYEYQRDQMKKCEPDAVAAAVLTSERPNMGQIERDFWLNVMRESGDAHGISVALFAALGGQESRFKAHLVSPVGARGAFQVMPLWIGTPECPKGSDLFEIETNAKCAAAILARYINEGKSVEAGLRRYVAGPHGQAKAQWYADQVLARLARATQKACPAAGRLYLSSTGKP